MYVNCLFISKTNHDSYRVLSQSTGISVVRHLPSIETTRDQSWAIELMVRDLGRVCLCEYLPEQHKKAFKKLCPLNAK